MGTNDCRAVRKHLNIVYKDRIAWSEGACEEGMLDCFSHSSSMGLRRLELAQSISNNVGVIDGKKICEQLDAYGVRGCIRFTRLSWSCAREVHS